MIMTEHPFPALSGEIDKRARELLREITRAHDLSWGDQPQLCTYAERDTTASVGGSVSQTQELPQTAAGISVAPRMAWGSASLGSGPLGCHERRRHGKAPEKYFKAKRT